MARPRKKGMEYFPHDVTAATDEKLLALQHLYGNDGYAFYFKILEMIFRGFSGKYNELDLSDNVLRRVVCKNIGVEMDLFEVLIDSSLKVGLFDRDSYEQRQVLTSKRVRSTYKEVQKQRKRQWKR